MTTFNPNSRSHAMLRHLSGGQANLSALRQACGAETGNAQLRRKAWYVVAALKEAGLIASEAGLYFITPTGREALAELEAGRETFGAARPSVRIFSGKGPGVAEKAPPEAA